MYINNGNEVYITSNVYIVWINKIVKVNFNSDKNKDKNITDLRKIIKTIAQWNINKIKR